MHCTLLHNESAYFPIYYTSKKIPGATVSISFLSFIHSNFLHSPTSYSTPGFLILGDFILQESSKFGNWIQRMIAFSNRIVISFIGYDLVKFELRRKWKTVKI